MTHGAGAGFAAPIRSLLGAMQGTWAAPYLEQVVQSWRTVMMYGLIAGGAGAGVSLLLPKVYVARATLISDTPSRPRLPGGLAQVAGQLGFLGLENDRPPQFYRDLMRSRRVLTTLATTRIHDSASGTLEPVFRVYSAGRISELTLRSTERIVRRLNRHLEATVDARTGAIRVALGGPTARQAAEALDSLLSLTNQFAVINLRSRARARREFAEAQVIQAQTNLEQAEESLRQFYERNRRLADSPSLQFEEARLRRRVDLRQEIYLSLSRELEQARLDEVRDTPILNIIDPPVPPARHDTPRRRILSVLAAFLGALAAVAGIVIQRARVGR